MGQSISVKVPLETAGSVFLVPVLGAAVIIAVAASLPGCAKTSDPVCKQGTICASKPDQTANPLQPVTATESE